jgi:hypothetical protein
MKQNEALKQAQKGQWELTIEAWEAYANLETAFNDAIECVERNYQDKDNWRLMRPEIEDFFADVTHYLRIAILNPKGGEQ